METIDTAAGVYRYSNTEMCWVYLVKMCGGVSEWFKVRVLKTLDVNSVRGFKSYLHRHTYNSAKKYYTCRCGGMADTRDLNEFELHSRKVMSKNP